MLYRLDSGNLRLQSGIPNGFLVNLFESISFNAEITATSQAFAGYFEEEYKNALGYFCMKACFESGNDRNSSIYARYIQDYQKVLEAKVAHIPCSEAPFSFGTKKLLEEAKVTELKDFVYMSIADIQNIPNISEWHVTDIIKNCLKLGVFIPEWEQWLINRNPGTSKIMDMGIDELDLSVRSFNSLKRAGVDTVGDLMNVSTADFVKCRHWNQKCWHELIRKFQELGLKAQWMIDDPCFTTMDKTPQKQSFSLDDKLNCTIDELDFGVHVFSALRRYGIKQIRDVVGLSENDLLHMPGFSRKMVEEIICKLRNMGLNLKEEHDAL